MQQNHYFFIKYTNQPIEIKMNKIFVLTNRLFLSCFLFLPCHVFAAEMNYSSIIEPVLELHKTLIEAMKLGESEQFEKRVELLSPVIKRSFDTSLISRIVIGRAWRNLDEAQQDEFVNLFNELTVTTYADRFNNYNQEIFSIKSTETLKNERYLIRTELKAADDTVALDYIVQQTDSQWKIVNVIANGISDLSLKRAEYAKVIKESGFSALVNKIISQIADIKKND
jgi:phospholipid transport system substrate-binding protein